MVSRIALGALKFAKISSITALSFGVGYAAFGQTWPSTPKQVLVNSDRKSAEALDGIQNSPLFKKLATDSSYQMLTASQLIPEAHRANHVGQGLLNSPNHLAVDPIVFVNKQEGKLYSFTHLGQNLVGLDGKVHNGVISTLLDENLCFCGFPKLPSRRGVTAKLTVDFKEKAAPNTNVVLVAEVTETKGRKCVIEGHVQTLPQSANEQAVIVAGATCVLVEPKWFKFLNWVPVFS